ncbi:neurofilament medium polypeptide [Nilaparvata lugens]|uniref:neurofilament medium polypeptide n=1 Tax=Nilaparvata lugens TaxID=108931 RepID=UPI00193DB504|nr:neurofilament medium polypeptide [Nilaparvata lugens]
MGASASKSRAHATKGRLSYSSNHPDRPSPPGKPQLVPVTSHFEPDVVTIRWDPPVYDGGSKITGYLVEHRRTGSPHWVRSSPALLRAPELTLSGLEPGWRYQFRVSAQNAAGLSAPGDLSELLTVTLQRTAASAPHFLTELRDLLATENEKAELTVEVRGTPSPTVAWYKDGVEVYSGRRHRIVTENGCSSLIIYQAALTDEGEFKCTATNRVGHAVTKATLTIQAPPSIRLPRQYEEGLLFEKDEVIRLKVTVAGKPLPAVTWHHNGEPIVNNNRCEVSTNERFAMLKMDEARRSDRGEYQVRAANQLGEDTASFLVTVTDRPQGPGKACVVMTLGRSVTLSWSAPEDDGGCKIGNYIVEYYRIGWNMWLKAATCRQLTTTLGDLIQGSEYKFRVKAENPFGVSEPGEESDILFIPDPQRGLLSAPEHRDETASAASKRSTSSLMDWLSSDDNSTSASRISPLPERTKRKLKTPSMSDDEEMRLEKEAFDKVRQRGPKAPKRRTKAKDKEEDIEAKMNTDYETRIKEKHKEEIMNDERRTKARYKEETEAKVNEKSEGKPDILRSESFQDKNDLTHGSSELMLVILPNRSRETTEERESTKREIMQSLEDTDAEIAPPMSLSAPELGSIEPETLLQRAWVSSTELLHERAMARFYQAAEENERERNTRRQRKVSSDRHSTCSSASSHSQGEMTAAAMFARSSSHEEIYREPRDTKLDRMKSDDAPTRKQSMYEDEPRYAQSTKQDRMKIDDVPPSRKQSYDHLEQDENRSAVEEELAEEEEEEEDYSIESVEEEEEEEDEEDYDLDDDDNAKRHDFESTALGESEGEYEERPSNYMIEEDTYHPRNMTPRIVSVQRKQNTNISDNLKAVTGLATAVVSHSITIPVAFRPVSTTIISKPMSNLKPPVPDHHVRIEVTPPPETEISRKSASPGRKSPSLEADQPYLPPRFTPDGRYLPNPKPQLPKPILKCRDSSEERTLSNQNLSAKEKRDRAVAPLANVESELNVVSSHSSFELTPERDKVKKKHVRISEPGDRKSDNSGSVKKTKSESRTEIETDATKCLIHHYSDIVKEYGHVKKVATPLYLNYEDLKAAAQKVEEAQYAPPNQKQQVDYIEEDTSPEIKNIPVELKDEKTIEKQETRKLFKDDRLELKIQPKTEVKLKESSSEVKVASSKNYDFDDRVAQLEKKMMAFQKCDDWKQKAESYQTPSKKESRSLKHIEVQASEPSKIENDPYVTEKKLHSYVDYLTDVAMFIVACWLYLCKDERLAIPVLAIMVYRQAKDYTRETYMNTKQAIKNKIPARWRHKIQ